MNRKKAENKGRRAEKIAIWWLRLHGWRILGQRVRNPRGEIDIIAKRWRTVIFVEVKARRNSADLATAIDPRYLARVAAAAESMLHIYGAGCDNMRIDAIWVAPWRLPHHLINIWTGSR